MPAASAWSPPLMASRAVHVVHVGGIQALKAVWHRGAVDADGKTGDGAGIHGLRNPAGIFAPKWCVAPAIPRARAGANFRSVMIFLPKT